MNKIQQTSQVNISPFLDPIEKEMIEFKQGKPISDMKRAELRIFISTLITKTHLECGQVLDTDTMKLTIESLIDNFLSYCGRFTLQQIVYWIA